jgi:hypothetical protein
VKPLRLMVFDRTCAGRGLRPGLSAAWRAGSILYRGLGRLDGSFGVTSWDEAFAWLAAFEPSRPIAEIQYWGHGKWGRALVDGEAFDASALRQGHRLHAGLAAVRERLAPDALLWFRTCETLGARAGHELAMRLADHLGARVAGHTFVIHGLQSGLHGVAPGVRPDWPADEGLAEGTAENPVRACWSAASSPHTITCLDGEVPAAWFTSAPSSASP